MKDHKESADTESLVRRKRFVRLVVIIVLLIALPVTIFFLRQQQILHSGATSTSMTFQDAQGNTITSTANTTATIRMVYGDTGTNPTATPTTPAGATATPTTATTNPTNTPVPGNRTLTVNPNSFHLGDTMTMTWSGMPNPCICFIEVIFPQTTVGGIFTGNGAFQVYMPTPTQSGCIVQPQAADMIASTRTSGSCTFAVTQSRFDNISWSYLTSYTQPVTANVVLHNYIGSVTLGTMGTVTLLP